MCIFDMNLSVLSIDLQLRRLVAVLRIQVFDSRSDGSATYHPCVLIADGYLYISRVVNTSLLRPSFYHTLTRRAPNRRLTMWV